MQGNRSGAFCLLAIMAALSSAVASEAPGTGSFLGAQSCSSSSCHGGAGDQRNESTTWSIHDFHHVRPFARLQTARAEQLARVLNISHLLQSNACTACHAPFATVPRERLSRAAEPSEGVSCESCHGPAEHWLRRHTRGDYTHADRVAAGMRDLKNIYVRANVCVACHQRLEEDIRQAGHPELMFELDGQDATMPRHWPKSQDPPGPELWLVGQQVALREISWQLSQLREGGVPGTNVFNQWAGLRWVLEKSGSSHFSRPMPGTYMDARPEDFKQTQEDCDRSAHEQASIGWTSDMTQKALASLGGSSEAFADRSIATAVQARRAERLVMALDRLTLALPELRTNDVLNQRLNSLFAGVQSLPDFDAVRFGNDLKQFHASAAAILEPK